MFSRRSDWPLTPNRLSRCLDELRRQGVRLLDLTESNPTRCGFAYEAEAILRSLRDPRALDYDPDPRGLESARLAVAEYYAERGARVDPEQIFLTTSTSEAYSFLFRLLADPGDNLAVPQPSYPLLDYLASLDSIELVPYRLLYDEGWRIDLESLAGARTPRLVGVAVIHPNNPTGSFVHPQEHRRLVDLCREWKVALIADEVFADYRLESGEAEGEGRSVSGSMSLTALSDKSKGRRITHAASAEVLTFTLSGLSKIAALPQMKLAWVILSGPEETLKPAMARLELIADTYLSLSAPQAHALPKLLAMRRMIQPQILERVRANLRALDAKLAGGSPVTRLKVEGGWYAVLRLPATRTDEDWAIEFLVKDGVLVHPGHFYDFASDGYIVLSLLPAADIFQEGISKLLARIE